MSCRPVRILFLIDKLWAGGTERQLLWLSDSLCRERFEPAIGLLDNDPFRGKLSAKTPVVRFDGPGPSLWRRASSIVKLKRYLEREHVDIVQTHFQESEMAGAVAVAACRRPPMFVATRRNLYHWVAEEPWTFWAVRLAACRADHVLVNSFRVFRACRKRERIRPRRMTVIQNAVDIGRFGKTAAGDARRILGLEGCEPIVGVIANWRPVKGLASFLACAGAVAREIPGVRFALVGFGPQEAELRRLAREHGIAEKVRFVGEVDDVSSILPAFDVAVQPSLSESFSNVLLEYMAAARPIVATTAGDAPVVIDNGENGLLVPPGSPEKLAASVIFMCRNRAEGRRMGLRAREKAAARWSSERILQKYHDFYAESLRERTARTRRR